jgi:hypothetical protein
MKKHMVVGKMSRDTVSYAILNNEWPQALQTLARKLRVPLDDETDEKGNTGKEKSDKAESNKKKK